jgi:GNAT superfamily N-acetyltransferase
MPCVRRSYLRNGRRGIAFAAPVMCEDGRTMTVTTQLLIERGDALEMLARLLEAEWPGWYNPRGASARTDLSERMRRDGLPLGIVALDDAIAIGTCALTATSGGLVTERSPWLGGLVVARDWRRRGVGQFLLQRGRAEARRLGYTHLHALTASADALFVSGGWRLLETTLVGTDEHRVYIARC